MLISRVEASLYLSGVLAVSNSVPGLVPISNTKAALTQQPPCLPAAVAATELEHFLPSVCVFGGQTQPDFIIIILFYFYNLFTYHLY